MTRDDAERLVDDLLHTHCGHSGTNGRQYESVWSDAKESYDKLIAALCREPNHPEADRQRRILDCAQDILAIMPDRWQLPSSVLIEIISRYIT